MSSSTWKPLAAMPLRQDRRELAGDDDVKMLFAVPDEPRQAAAFQQLLDIGGRSLDGEPLDVREAGNLTIEYGRYILGIEPEGGEAMTDVGKYVLVHETRGDETKILLDCFNSNSPLPA